ncbi:hypothetical protein DAPPUDRAFT_336401 [Daphnia pulex]|uniref:Uncharacterized protein n=1 Tax=Daphnia pulex TaxID=6669 RepID=E9HZL8_DAPPU|nr:hypothetical protein DAPPUDRAFT_336401 [Daphnia pulex]|eukprot:EFX62812.1 hypothetical protein DAPPUDRAFT_336401 [Daphnia pulex]
MVGNCVSSFFAELNQNQAAKLKKSDIEAYMDMVVFLETNPDTCCRLRVSYFILFFYKLRPSSLLRRMVSDLKTQYCWIFKSMQYFRFLFYELCENLISLPEVSSAGNAENLSVASNPLNNKENKEDNQTIFSSESRSPTPFDTANEHPEFLLQINVQATTSPLIQSSVDPDNSKVARHESENPQVLVPFHSPRDIISNYNDLGSTTSISSGGFCLERFRELLDLAVEEVASITGGSISSKSDYLSVA